MIKSHWGLPTKRNNSQHWLTIETDFVSSQVNVPKTRRTYCKGKDCKKHTQHKVTQYKAGKVGFQNSPTSLLSCSSFPGFSIRPRKAPIRSQTVRLWWSDETRVPQESKDNKEGRVEVRVHIMQDEGTAIAETMQAFRVGVRGFTILKNNGC